MEGGADRDRARLRREVSAHAEPSAWRAIQQAFVHSHRPARTPAHTTLHAPTRRYPYIYLMRYHNMRTEQFKELREEVAETSRCVGTCGPGCRRHGA